MLLTDGNPNTTEDLRTYESSILGVANAERIDLSIKLGLATEEITQDVLDFLLHRAGGGDPHGNSRRSIGASDVIVTRQMKRWHALHSLAVTYRDAFQAQLNDRYRAKFQEYKELASDARRQTFLFGIGLVHAPLPKAPVPSFEFVEGTVESTTYFGRVAWVSAAGHEGMPSDLMTYDAAAGTVPVVTVGMAPENAAGFNVYLGLAPETLAKQNAEPVAIGGLFTVPGDGLIAGLGPGNGQTPDLYLTEVHTLRRG